MAPSVAHVENRYAGGSNPNEKHRADQSAGNWKRQWDYLTCGWSGALGCAKVESSPKASFAPQSPKGHRDPAPPRAAAQQELNSFAPKGKRNGSKQRAPTSQYAIKASTREKYQENLPAVAKKRLRAQVAFESGLVNGQLWKIERALSETGNSDLAKRTIPGPEQFTPLMVLAMHAATAQEKQGKIINRLVVYYGCNVNAEDAKGLTALLHAVSYGNVEAANELHQRGAELGTSHILNPFSYAITSDNVRMCEWTMYQILRQDSNTYKSAQDFVNAQDTKGYPALCYAAQGGELNSARWLLPQKVDVNGKTSCGRTAVQLAAVEGRVDLIDLLLRHGASLDDDHHLHKDSHRWLEGFGWQAGGVPRAYAQEDASLRSSLRALHMAVKDKGVRHIVQAVESFEFSPSIPMAANQNWKQCAVNGKDCHGRTAVLIAAQYHTGGGLEGLLERLIDVFGGDADKENDHGETVLMLAARHASGLTTKTMGVLMAKCTREDLLEVQDAQGRSVAAHCFASGSEELVLKMLRFLVDGDSTKTLLHIDCRGWSLLDYAASAGYPDVIKWVLTQTKQAADADGAEEVLAEVRRRTLDGGTALLLAAHSGSLQCCEQLFAAKADLMAKDDLFRDFYDYAIERVSASDRKDLLKWWQDEVAAEAERAQRSRSASKMATDGLSLIQRSASKKLTNGVRKFTADIMMAVGLLASGRSGESLGERTGDLELSLASEVKSKGKEKKKEPTSEVQLKRAKSIVKERWQCTVCQGLNVADKAVCIFCGTDPTPPDLAYGGKIGEVFMFNADDGEGGGGERIKYCNEFEDGSTKVALRHYRDGHLESRVSKLVCHWESMTIEEHGFEYNSDGRLTSHRSKSFIYVSPDDLQRVFASLIVAGKRTKVKIKVVGGPYANDESTLKKNALNFR